MNIKKYLFRFLILLSLNCAGLTLGMNTLTAELRPIDKVFLNACKKNTDIRFALKNGANPKSIDPESGYTGLHYACMNDNLDRVKWFLKQDWNLLNIKGKNGSDPIEVASEYGHIAIKQYLIDRQLIYLCQNFSGPFFQSTATNLLLRGGNINAKADDSVEPGKELKDFTPLLYACMDGEVEKVKFLLSHGADVNQKSDIGVFPLYVIFSSMTGGDNESKRFELTKILLAHGADLGLTGPKHHGILSIAVRANSVQCIKLLLDKGIDVNVVDENNHNALYYAVADNLPYLVELLFDVGVKPISDIEGISLVHIAAILNNVLILKELIKRGLDVNLVDNDGQTPLHYAAEQAGVEVIKALLDAGAFINSVDKAGKTPLMLAKKNPHKQSLVYLQKESHKPVSAQKIVQVMDQPALSRKKVTEKVIEEQATKNPKKKKKNRKKKKKKESATFSPIKEDEASSQEGLLWQNLEQESTAHAEEYKQRLLDLQEEKRKRIGIQESVKQSEIEPIKTELAPIEQSVEQIQTPQLSKIKKPKKSLVERVQEKVVDTLITPKTKKSFADALATQVSQKQAKKEITDDNLKIAVPVDRQKKLMITSNQENPLAEVIKYSKHVEEKRNDPNDYFHNFSPKVEQELGYLAQQKVLKPATKDDSAKIQYTIPATVSFVDGKNIFPGAFEFVVQNETMLHRFFKPKEKIDKKKMQLMLPASTSNKGEAKLPK